MSAMEVGIAALLMVQAASQKRITLVCRGIEEILRVGILRAVYVRKRASVVRYR